MSGRVEQRLIDDPIRRKQRLGITPVDRAIQGRVDREIDTEDRLVLDRELLHRGSEVDIDEIRAQGAGRTADVDRSHGLEAVNERQQLRSLRLRQTPGEITKLKA